eukprot:TRINITY_DN2425_c0_g1_i1.p1 TRINITY_DN2425_c0_g1~~TRINITY_DN2425_c0_g1_i1.p1  ORF type:complete len:603 (-),score=160.55 TRINITY_DN2425_c0_g1_i1:28-1836(-)
MLLKTCLSGSATRNGHNKTFQLLKRKTGTKKRFVKNRFYSTQLTEEDLEILNAERDADETDLLIVGGGPAGLSAAIRFRQLCMEHDKDYRVVLLEKGAEVGNHILSGAVLEPQVLTELIPDWKEKGAPVKQEVTRDETFFLLNEKSSIRTPVISLQQNHGNYIISLGNLCRWLSEQAEELGAEIYAGFPASEVVYHEDGSVKGVATGDAGISKSGKPSANFERGMEFHSPLTLFAEGCRGSCSKKLIQKFNLSNGPQKYGIGIKEVWEIPPEKHEPGLVRHTLGWPMDTKTWGGSFMYHAENNQVFVGYVVGLDYKNPYLSPYREFQRLKHHPTFSKFLEGGKCISYGARALNEGGLQSVPELIFPGGALLGCSAGFLNVPKIKGSHNAMKSGILAAEAAFEELLQKEKAGQTELKALNLTSYPDKVKNSSIWKELVAVRNFKPAFDYGLIPGMLFSGIHWLITKGKEPFTLKHKEADHEATGLAKDYKPIDYPKPDGKLSFDILTNLARSGTSHNDDQPPHLKVLNPEIPVSVNLEKHAGPEGRFCPAGVYEYLKDSEGKDYLQINAQNCLHCKTCDIKDKCQNIDYTTPEPGGGPAYSGM